MTTDAVTDLEAFLDDDVREAVAKRAKALGQTVREAANDFLRSHLDEDVQVKNPDAYREAIAQAQESIRAGRVLDVDTVRARLRERYEARLQAAK